MTSARQRYQDEFAGFFGAPLARAYGMGRHALMVLLRAMGIGSGSRVGVCGFTCLSVSEAIMRLGALPVYLDTDEFLCINPDSLAALNPGDIDVLIIQHTFGLCGKIDELFSQAKRLGVPVIEDCAHSFASRQNGKYLGTRGAGAIFSSQWGKSYSTGQGGMLIVNDASLAEKVCEAEKQLAVQMPAKSDAILAAQRAIFAVLGGPAAFMRLRDIYRSLIKRGLAKGSFSHDIDFSQCEGIPQFAGPLLAGAGLRQIRGWNRTEKIRRLNVKMIESSLKSAGLQLWPMCADCDPVMLRYPVLVRDKVAVLKKVEFARIDLAGWYDSPVHPLHGDDLGKVGYVQGTCPQVEQTIAKLVHLPTGLACTEKTVEAAIRILKDDSEK